MCDGCIHKNIGKNKSKWCKQFEREPKQNPCPKKELK